MAAKQVLNLGKGGLNKDVPAVLLPENVFTDVRNVRFGNDSVSAITGEVLYKNLSTITPGQGIFWRRPDQGYNIFLKNGLAVRVDAAGNEATIFTSADPKYNNSVWDCITFNGGYAIVVNNGKSTPLYLLYNSLVAGTNFQELPGWNYIGGLTVFAKVVRQLGYSLVAANLTLDQAGTVTYAPSTIRISVQAATGQIPSVWLPGLTTDTADEFEINSTSPILDMKELRGVMYVYSDDSIHALTINTGNTRLQPYASGYGILNTNCVEEFDGKHLVVDRNDIYVHNGSGGIQSIADERVRNYFFNTLNKSQSDKVFVKRHAKNDEIWVYFPTGASTVCNEALIYQYRHDVWSIRDVPNVVSAFKSFSTNGSSYVYADERVYMTTSEGNRVFIADEGYQMWNTTTDAFYNHTCYVAKDKLNVGDTLGTYAISSFTPIFDSVSGGADLTVTVTGQNNYMAAADYSNASGRDAFHFLPNNTDAQGYKVDPRTKGRLLNYKISGVGPWRLALYGADIGPADRR